MIFEKVKEIIVENLGCEEEEVLIDTNLIEDLEADSLDIVDISLQLEEEYGIKVEEEDFEKLKTVKDIVEYIEAKQE